MDRRNSEAATVVVSTPLGRTGNGTGSDGAGPGGGGDGSFDTNMVIILAALFFALLFAIGLNSVARCALRCGDRGAGASAAGGGGEGASSRGASRGGGIKKRALRSIPVEVYGGGGGAQEEEEEEVCAICLGEFADGEKVRVLPRCGHGFHVPCVDAWLLSRGSCPTCRRPVMEGKKTKEAKPGAAGQSRRPPDSDDTIAVVIA
ncbi:unnamed protein product [Urochloa humidicola]